MPPSDADFSTRWSNIKRHVSLASSSMNKHSIWMSQSRRDHRESTLWQRRFWEHQIRDKMDFKRHVDYIHHNPIKHGLCKRVAEWPYSTFHRYVEQGIYSLDWADSGDEIVTARE